MRIRSNVFRGIERGLLALGVLLLTIFSLAYIHRVVMSRAEITEFEARQDDSGKQPHDAAKVSNGSQADPLYSAGNIDSSLSSAQHTESYQAKVGNPSEVLALLRISRLHLEVPVLDGTDEITLNRGVGRIAGTARVGQNGNLGIAGHRDGFFRPLKDIVAGDLIELVTTSGTDVYTVDRVQITDPTDVGVLEPRTKPSLTLVTCYPFYFVGPAPDRYIVEASLNQYIAQIEE